jgi:hypothetical protein
MDQPSSRKCRWGCAAFISRVEGPRRLIFSEVRCPLRSVDISKEKENDERKRFLRSLDALTPGTFG